MHRSALVIQHAKHMCHTVVSSVAYLAVSHFSTVCHEGMIFGKRVTKYNICVLIFSTTFVSNISHSKKNLIRYDQKCYVGLQAPSSYPLFLSDFNET
jgi:hypothetical protein